MSSLTSLLDEKTSRIVDQVDNLYRETAGEPSCRCVLDSQRFAGDRRHRGGHSTQTSMGPARTSRTIT